MPYSYLDHLTSADVSFEAIGKDLEELFRCAADATLNSMVNDLTSVQAKLNRDAVLRSAEAELEPAAEQLLHDFLQKLLYFKDAEQLLLRVGEIHITRSGQAYELRAKLFGEAIEPRRHELVTDVKAVTMHRFRVERIASGWKATVVLDV